MKNSKTFILYICRLLLVLFIAKPLLSLLPESLSPALILLLWMTLFMLSAVYAFLLVRSYEIKFYEGELSFSKGVVFRKKLRIKYESLTAISRFSSPLEQHFSLMSLLLHTEGKSFWLFPVSEAVLRKIAEKGELPL